jgi:S1-C subfamily serine protease
VIDVLLVLLLASYALSGYRQGLAIGGLSLAGFLLGSVIAMWVAPLALDPLGDSTARTVVLVLAVLAIAWLGQYLGAQLGNRLRGHLKVPALELGDHLLGGFAGVVTVSLVMWFIGGAIRDTSLPWLPTAVSSSKVLGVVDALVPSQLNGVATKFRQTVSDSGFPRVFAGVTAEQILPVPAPTPGVMPAAVQNAVRRSIVKITGEAPACHRGQEGSGSVVAPHRVVTNAHVVAGVRKPQVQVAGSGRKYAATVVLFDPEVDIAVLDVPDLTAPALLRGTPLERASDAVVVGFPKNGPYTVVPARVRSVIQASGDDIYARPGVVREVYSLYTKVEQGNSGGPLLDPAGRLTGVVFAKSLDDPQTGYALTLAAVTKDLDDGVAASAPISTGGCSAG